ncbi:MAG: LacI family DNA-binding transcriptional regulator [Opitutaceae bacterium]
MKEAESDKSKDQQRRRVTLRDIAAEMGISHVTVSKALRNLSGVSDKLKEKVLAKADAMGYVPDPLLSSLSRYRASSHTKPIQSVIAWINPWEEPEQLRQHHNEFDLYWQGASDCAKRLGYQLESFNTIETPLSRLQSIFKARSIQGILIPPIGEGSIDLGEIDWSSFATVRLGRVASGLKMHFVGSAQIANAMMAFERARDLGYQRIGFVCEYWATRYFGAGYSWAQRALPVENQLPLLALNPEDSFERQQVAFDVWLKESQPDAIITDNSETLEMLQNLNFSIPDDVGLATTSIHDTTIDTGIDQSPYEIGRAAVRMLTALIAEKSFGQPEQCNETLIEGKWVDGSMLPDCRRT